MKMPPRTAKELAAALEAATKKHADLYAEWRLARR